MFALAEVTGEPVAGGVKYKSSLTGSANADEPKVKGEPSTTIGRTSLVRQRKVGLGILYLGSPRPAPSPFPSHNGTSSPPSPPSVTGCIKGFSEAEKCIENGIKTTNFINQNLGLEKCNES